MDGHALINQDHSEGGSIMIHVEHHLCKVNTANTSKLTENYFLDLRNLFSNQENMRIFSQNKKNKLTAKNFLVPSARKFDLN